MILYLYALADGLDNVDGIAGARGEPLMLIPLDSATAVAGEIDAAPDVSRHTLAAQDGCVRALHARAAALLPMRFGATMADRNAAARAVAALGPMLRDRLDLVRGREQVTLWIAHAGHANAASGASKARGDEQTAGPGRRYLQQRAAQSLPEPIVELVESLKPLVRATRIDTAGREPAIATIYHLIDRGTSARYLDAVEAAASRLSDFRIRRTGPSPAYAFADLRLR